MRINFTQLTRFFLLVLYLTVCSTMVNAQATKTVKGVVKDVEDNSSIPGATVKVRDTNIGVATDIDGKFSIAVPAGSTTLIFSAIGMQIKEVKIADQTNLQIVLSKQTTTLNDVVVVGYGVQKKSLVTGAISSITTKDLEVPGLMRADQALQGKAAGVTVMLNSGQPGAGVSIRIRGAGTNGSNDPLYIVDGFPRGDLEAINPRDIETMEVLKDAASAAIYGARGANGVVIITTKTGKAGKPRIDYEYYYGLQNTRKNLDLLDASQYARIQNEAFFNSNLPMPFSENEIAKLGTGTNWQNEIAYKNAPIQNHQLSMSGGSENSTFAASFSYFTQAGTIAKGKSDFARYTGRINSQQKFLDGILNTGINLSITNVQRDAITSNSGNAGPILSAINMDPVTPVMNDDGTFAISRYVSQEVVNPVARIYYTNGTSGYTRFNGDVFGELHFSKSLKLRSSLGYGLQYDVSAGYTPIYYLNSTNQTIASGASAGMAESKYLNQENVLTYSTVIKKHSITALIGNTVNTGSGTNVSGSKNGLLYDDPAFAYLDLAKDNTSAAASGGAFHTGLISYFGRVNYDYGGKYLFTGTMRADGSYRFGPNNKIGYFPSFSVGWNVSQEKFMANIRAISSLKVRASWGRTGSDAIGDYRYVSTISTYARNYYFGSGGTQVVGASPSGVSNDDLKWETSEQTDFGIDAEFLGNFNATLDLYKKETKGLLVTIPIPLYVGNSAPTGNAGNVVNKGIELTIGYRKSFGKLYFEANVNGAYNYNNVTFVGTSSGFIDGSAASNQMTSVTRMQAGFPIGYFWLYTMKGIFQNQAEINNYQKNGVLIQPNAVPGDIKYEDINNDGKIDNQDRSMVGTPHPKFNYGLNLTARYKGFDVNVFFNGLAGNKIFNSLHRWDLPTANYPTSVLNRWHGEGTSNTFPRVSTGDLNGNFVNPSTFFLEDGDYLRLRNASIGYTIRDIKKIKVKTIRVYATGTNLFVLTKYTGFDPEVSGSALGLGIDRGVYPQARTIMFGASIGF